MSTGNRSGEQARGDRAALSRERIAAAALELVDRDGLDAFSMRRLAGHLGTGTMTLYGYFRDKDELLDAVVDAAAAATRDPAQEPEGDWRTVLRGLAVDLRAGLTRHPSVIELRLRRPLMSPGAMRGTELGLRAMLAAGFTRAQAASGFRILFLYTFGFAAFSAERVPESMRVQAREALGALPPDDYPATSAAIEEMVDTLGGERQFLFGIDRILDGLDAHLRTEPPPQRPR